MRPRPDEAWSCRAQEQAAHTRFWISVFNLKGLSHERRQEFAQQLRGTVARYEPVDCFRALRVCVELYRSLRLHTNEIGGEAERAAMEYVSELEQRYGLTPR